MQRIQIGDAIAVAVEGFDKVPVGRVVDVDDDAIKITLFSWLLGEFTGPEALIRRRDIKATIFATKSESTRTRTLPDGASETFTETVFDMDPLGIFQDQWAQKPTLPDYQSRRSGNA